MSTVTPRRFLLRPFLFILFLLMPTITASLELSKKQIIARRSQRDLSANISISQLSLSGVDLSTSLFDEFGYTLDSVAQVYDILNVGIQTLLVDLYWNEQLEKFQLCPDQFQMDSSSSSGNSSNSSNSNITSVYTSGNDSAVVCLRSLSFNDLTSFVQSYIKDSDTNLSADLIVLILNLHHLNNTSFAYPEELRGTWNDTLTSVMTNYFDHYMYTPIDLQTDRAIDVNKTNLVDGYPRLSKFLFTNKRRMIPIINQYEIPSYSNYNASMDSNLFFNMTQLNTSFSSFDNTTTLDSIDQIKNKASQNWRFSIDSPSNQFTSDSIHDQIINGYSPLLNHTVTHLSNLSSDLFGNSLWLWPENEPLFINEAFARYSNDSQYIQEAYSCAAMFVQNGSFHVSNCYQEKKVLMMDKQNTYNWTVSDEKVNYFHGGNFDDNKWSFNVPKDALQRASVVLMLNSVDSDTDVDVWVDLNSINVDNCWVTGGPYASCPYQTVSSNRNFVEMMGAASVCCLIIIILIILLRLRPVSIRDNRKHWKKLLNQYSTTNYDGVPA